MKAKKRYDQRRAYKFARVRGQASFRYLDLCQNKKRFLFQILIKPAFLLFSRGFTVDAENLLHIFDESSWTITNYTIVITTNTTTSIQP